MARPFVSVLIDTYNHERFIEEAVASVLGQDFSASDREILVVDDGSTDKTQEILQRFEPHIRILRKVNGGQASAFNQGIPECRGEVIAFLDGDDWWLPGKLSCVAGLMAKDASLGVIGHAIVQVSENGSQQAIGLSSQAQFRLDSVPSAEFFRLNRCYFGTSRLTLRSEVARRILPVPEALVFEADEYLFTLAPVLADTLISPNPLTCYRLHGTNLFMASGASREGERRKQRILSALASELRLALARYGAPADVASVLLEMVDLEATQLRLQFEGGSPWETYRTEIGIYRIQHAAAPRTSKVFRALSMIPALLLPPRLFYIGRRWLGSQSWYRRARRDLIPFPQMVKPSASSTCRASDKS